MKRVLRFLVLLTLIACVVYPVSAEAAEMPNWDDYTYEELVEIRTELDAYIQNWSWTTGRLHLLFPTGTQQQHR